MSVNVNTYFKETGVESINWLYVAQDKDKWCLVNTVVDFQVPENKWNLLNSSGTVNFSRTPLQEVSFSCMKCCICVVLVQASCFRPAQSVKILIALAVYCTYGLQFYVCLEIAWNGIKNTFTKRPVVSEYAMRTFLIALTG
jgi:hypothetical protein